MIVSTTDSSILGSCGEPSQLKPQDTHDARDDRDQSLEVKRSFHFCNFCCSFPQSSPHRVRNPKNPQLLRNERSDARMSGRDLEAGAAPAVEHSDSETEVPGPPKRFGLMLLMQVVLFFWTNLFAALLPYRVAKEKLGVKLPASSCELSVVPITIHPCLSDMGAHASDPASESLCSSGNAAVPAVEEAVVVRNDATCEPEEANDKIKVGDVEPTLLQTDCTENDSCECASGSAQLNTPELGKSGRQHPECQRDRSFPRHAWNKNDRGRSSRSASQDPPSQGGGLLRSFWPFTSVRRSPSAQPLEARRARLRSGDSGSRDSGSSGSSSVDANSDESSGLRPRQVCYVFADG